jgi:hypothetical protein
MFSAMLLAISLVALAQFALYYWRALLTGVASQPIANEILLAAQVSEEGPCAADFQRLASLLTLTPELKSSRASLGFVPAYYKIIGAIDDLFGRLFPALNSWSQQEQALCARYAAVQIGRRLEANLAQAASIRSC